MRKLLLLSFLAISLSSCDKDDDCMCEVAYYIKPGSDGYYSYENVPIDCKTGKPTTEPDTPGLVFRGCKTKEEANEL